MPLPLSDRKPTLIPGGIRPGNSGALWQGLAKSIPVLAPPGLAQDQPGGRRSNPVYGLSQDPVRGPAGAAICDGKVEIAPPPFHLPALPEIMTTCP